jgi:PAS domain S-box-containing protein
MVGKGKKPSKRRAEALKVEGNINQLLLDSLPHTMMVISKDRKILAANRTAKNQGIGVGGYCWEEFGRSAFISEKDREYIEKHKKPPKSGPRCYFCHADEALREKETKNVEVEAWNKIWDTYWVPLDEDNYLHYAIDITQTKKAEKKLQISETKFRRLFESAQDGILILDAGSGEITDVNPFLIDLLNYDEDEILGKKLWELGAFRDVEASRRAFTVLKNESYIRYEDLPLETNDGRKIDVEFVSNIYRVDGKKVIQCNIREITERKQAEKALKESEEKARAITDTSMDAIIMIDGEGKVTYANSAAEMMFGYNKSELIGNRIHDLIVSEHARKQYELKLTDFKKKGKCKVIGKTLELNATRRDGTRFPVEISISAVRIGGDWHSVGMIRDISDRKKVEDERTVLLDISQNISRTIDLERLLDIAVKKTVESVDVDRISIILIDEGGKGTYQAAYNKKGEKVSASKVIDIYDYTRLKEAIQKKKTVYVKDALDPNVQSPIDVSIAARLGIGSGIHIPLIFTDKVVGVINFLAVGRAREFEEQEIKFYETIANQLSAMIANAELYEELRKAKGSLEKDVQERTRELSKSEEKYRSLVETQNDAIFVVNSRGHFVFMNQGGLDMTGYSGDEAMKLHYTDLLAPEHHEKIAKQFKKHLKDPSTYRYETLILTKDGKRLDVEAVTMPLLDDGRTVAIQGIARDISESKRAQEQMMRQLMKFKLEPGRLYLASEFEPTISVEAFLDLLRVGYPGLIISRTPEDELRKKIEGDFKFLWLSESKEKNSIYPRAREIKNLIRGLPRKCVVLIDRLDYLINKNGFKRILSFVHFLREHAYLEDHIIILSIDPSTLSEKEIRLLEKETNKVLPKYLGRLPEELLEIVKFLFTQNKIGLKPSYNVVGREVGASQPTVRKRIRNLIGSGYVREFAKGNRKVVELTEMGQNLFLK